MIVFSSHVRQRNVPNLDIVVPLVKQLNVADLLHDILGENVGDNIGLDLDIATVRHIGLFAVDNISGLLGWAGGLRVSSAGWARWVCFFSSKF